MERVQLAGFPLNKWPELDIVPKLETARETLQSSLQLNPANLTANYRLGLIYMLRRDFPSAVVYLERAYQETPDQRGIIKSLGYCYVWLGDTEHARALLESIPEARDELDVYIWWWDTQGRKDLAQKATVMLTTFDTISMQP